MQTIARDILNHCFIYFVTEQVPKIVISDEGDTISINQMYDNIGKENISEEKFTINETDFKLVHFKNYNPNSNAHKLNLCANERSVTSVNLQKMLTGVNSKFSSGSSEFVYVGYITSKYLDDNVNIDRNVFNLIGIASRTLKENGMTEESKEMSSRVFASGSYEEALSIIGEYVNITSAEELNEDIEEKFGIET